MVGLHPLVTWQSPLVPRLKVQRAGRCALLHTTSQVRVLPCLDYCWLPCHVGLVRMRPGKRLPVPEWVKSAIALVPPGRLDKAALLVTLLNLVLVMLSDGVELVRVCSGQHVSLGSPCVNLKWYFCCTNRDALSQRPALPLHCSSSM